MNNIKKLTQKDRHGNMISFEFDVPPMESIPHPGQPIGTDTVPAWLTPGERVMNAEAERMYGPILYQMNEQGRAVQRAQGGTIPEYAAMGCKVKYKAQGGPVYLQGGGRPNEWFYDPRMLDAVRQVESGGNPNAVSKAGAVGPYQIMPETAAQPGYSEYGVRPIAQEDLTDEKKSREFAMNYLAALQARNPEATPEQILQMYNAGEGRVRADMQGTGTKPLTQETVQYGDKVLAQYGAVPSLDNVSTPAPEVAEALPQGTPEQPTSDIRLESVEDFANFYNNQLLAGRGDRETYENALISQFGISPGQAQALITSEYAGEGLVKGIKSPDQVLSEIASGNIAGSDLARVGDPLPRVDIPPVDGAQVPPTADVEAPPKPLTGLEGVGIEQPEDDRGQAYGDGLKVQLGAVEQQLINLQEEAKDPRKAAELISSITELRNQRNRLADMYDEWAATQGTKQALGYGTEQAVPSYTQDDIELQSPRGTLEERRERQLITEDVPKPVEVPEPIAQGLEQTETGKQIKEEAKVAQKEQATTSIVQQTEKEDSPAKTNTPPETVEQKGNEVGETNPDAKSTAENFFEEFGLSDLFDKKEIGRMVAMYLGSRALGYSHGGSLNFAAKNYAQRLDTKSKTEAAQKAKLNEQAFQLAKEGKHSPKSIENYRRTGNLAYLDLGTSQGVGKGEYKEFFREGKKYRAQKIEMPDGSVQYRTDQGLTIDGSFNDDAAFHKGTPEYDKRRETANNNNVAIFEEAFEMAGGKDSDTNDWTQRLKVGPQKAAREFWAWSESARLDPNSNEARTIMNNAYQQALQDAKDGKVIIPSLEPYLKGQLFRETTGTTDMWLLNPEEVADGKQMPKYVRQDQMNVLLDNVERVARKKLPNSSLTDAKKTIFDQAMNSWANLPDAERQSWLDSTEKEAGVTGFYLFINDELQKAYSN